MKRYLITLFALLAVLTGCERFDADDHKFGNVVYLTKCLADESRATGDIQQQPRDL